MFRGPEAVKSFLEFYSKFDFLEPPGIGKYGRPPDDSAVFNPGGMPVQMAGPFIFVTDLKSPASFVLFVLQFDIYFL